MEFQLASPKYKPLFTLRDPESGSRPEHIVLPGGRNSAKSLSTALAILYHGRNPKLLQVGRGLRIVVTRQFGSSVDASFWEELSNAAKLMGCYEEWEWGVKRIKHKSTRTMITSMGLERNKGNIKGLSQVDILVVEEASYVSQESVDILIPTVRKPHSVIIWIYNPDLPTDPVANTFVECETPYPGALIINTHWTDNRFMSARSNNDRLALLKSDPLRYKTVYDGEYSGAGSNTVIAPYLVQEAMSAHPVVDPRTCIVAGWDVSGQGADEAVIVRRQGNRVLSTHTKAKGDTQEMVSWAKEIFIEHGWDTLVVDATGSPGQAHLMQQYGDANRTFNTIPWIASWKARDPGRFSNARTQVWFAVRDWLAEGGQLTRNREWAQLSAPTYRYQGKELKALDSKRLLKDSPDWGDALSLTLWVPDTFKTAKEKEIITWANAASYHPGEVEY